MQYPKFYDDMEPIVLQDGLAGFLGASKDGILEFSYLDIIKSAGHSCPTVLGAFLMTQAALAALYKDELPQRGEIKVAFQDEMTNGVTGVISNVVKNITGATVNEGFKGLAGNFDRRHLLSFEQNIRGDIRFTRRDTNISVDVVYDASIVGAHPDMSPLMQKSISNMASQEEIERFGQLWQERVENIYQRRDEVIRVQLVKA